MINWSYDEYSSKSWRNELTGRQEETDHTVLAYSHMLEAEFRRLKKVLRLETKEDKETFDRLFTYARFHNSAGVYQSHPFPFYTIFFSILLEHEKRITEMAAKLKDIR